MRDEMMRKRMMNQEDAAIAAAIAAVKAANNAAAGAVHGSDAEAMDAAIYDFAALIELDDEGVDRGVDDGSDGVAARGDDVVGDGNVSSGNVGVGNVGVGGGGGRGLPRKGKVRCCFQTQICYITMRRSLAR